MSPIYTSQDAIKALVKYLTGQGWAHARHIRSVFGFNTRKIRALAHASDGQILSGQRGYKLTAEATRSELEACMDQQLSQIIKTEDRIADTKKVWLSTRQLELKFV